MSDTQRSPWTVSMAWFPYRNQPEIKGVKLSPTLLIERHSGGWHAAQGTTRTPVVYLGQYGVSTMAGMRHAGLVEPTWFDMGRIHFIPAEWIEADLGALATNDIIAARNVLRSRATHEKSEKFLAKMPDDWRPQRGMEREEGARGDIR